MPYYGQYDAQNDQHSSTLFAYQEKPLASAKLNQWNGNLAAGFTLLHAVLRTLATPNQTAILTGGAPSALRVEAQDPPNRTVRLLPGWALLPHGFAGLDQALDLPPAGNLTPPVQNPRIDRIVLQASGEPLVLTGEEAVAPTAPAIPDGAIALAAIEWPTGATAIVDEAQPGQAVIHDQRPGFLAGEAHRHAADLAPPESPDGARTAFTTAAQFRAGTLQVFRNGLLQEEGIDYHVDAGRRGYTFVQPPYASDRIQHRYLIEIIPQ